ncbi:MULTISPECIES: haloacid dehalogenase-like hydrolase [Bifidobacterium]|uniref:haloacid dehalogenase-like hydrolase n=1 Tax=Bifidobacterium TaxID=1678 RepID=UPI001BDDC488|nr:MULTISPECIES: haloacid dehalogenase-like hydrolase [Bifidobacterium]MBT1162445.1 haloacid dehalogenase-like hydrolase [Bifidobacterium sp. SO1]MBW3078288.1 haloacid dehalogenase-like hydrolase [Bifidobacterium simiiventris]
MRVFDFDGTIYDGESLFDLYLFSARYDPKVFRHIAPVLRYAIKYKLGKATLEQMERGVGDIARKYLHDLAGSRTVNSLCDGEESEERPGDLDAILDGVAHDVETGRIVAREERLNGGLEALVSRFWDRNMRRIKPWYRPQPDDVILTASFDVTVGEACRRLGVHHLVASTIDPDTLEVTYLNFNTNKPKRFRELFGDVPVDEFYTDSKFDQPMIDLSRKAYMVKGDRITRIK